MQASGISYSFHILQEAYFTFNSLWATFIWCFLEPFFGCLNSGLLSISTILITKFNHSSFNCLNSTPFSNLQSNDLFLLSYRSPSLRTPHLNWLSFQDQRKLNFVCFLLGFHLDLVNSVDHLDIWSHPILNSLNVEINALKLFS
jgi:hypothetical protein